MIGKNETREEGKLAEVREPLRDPSASDLLPTKPRRFPTHSRPSKRVSPVSIYPLAPTSHLIAVPVNLFIVRNELESDADRNTGEGAATNRPARRGTVPAFLGLPAARPVPHYSRCQFGGHPDPVPPESFPAAARGPSRDDSRRLCSAPARETRPKTSHRQLLSSRMGQAAGQINKFAFFFIRFTYLCYLIVCVSSRL